MSLFERYELLDLIAENETRTYLARERSTVRMVMVHQLLPGPNRVSLLEMVLRIRTIPSSPGSLQVMDLGEHEGMPYVVTEIIHGFQTLRAWLQAELACATQSPSPAAPSQAGAWLVPAVAPEELAPQEAAPQRPIAPGPSVQPAAPAQPRPSPGAAPQAPRRDPGEFTQLFQVVMADIHKAPPASPHEPAPPAPGVPTAPAPVPPALATPPPAEPPRTVPSPAAPEPGEFTRMFQAGWHAGTPAQSPPPTPFSATTERPAPGATPPPTEIGHTEPAPPSLDAELDEFARLFQQSHVARPAPPAVVPQATPSQAPSVTPPTSIPPGSEPGEFTRMFQSPLAPGPLESQPSLMPAGPAPPMSPVPSPAAQAPWGATPSLAGTPGAARGGEFTQIFGSPAGERVPAPPPSFTGPSGGATQLFSGPSAQPAPPLPSPGGGPGEFTRMVSAAPAQTAAPGPVAPVQASQAMPARTAGSPYLPLFLILGFVLLVVLALTLYFVLRH